ncbi:MAG: hypothetical protein J6Y37_13945 [Paludibacteraceae bacterium]|nr:hypothetical protein [Paludibacteraceae bacterium]
MNKIEISIDKEMKMYGETMYQVFYGYHFLFSFVNRFKGEWLFYNANSAKLFAIIKSEGVPMEQITNLAVAFATIIEQGVIPTDTSLYGVKVRVNRKAEAK